MSAVGAGSNVNVNVLSPLSTATGPELGSQFHHGPVITTELAPSQTVVVIISGGYVHDPSSIVAVAS
jgi:hypothetical protein